MNKGIREQIFNKMDGKIQKTREHAQKIAEEDFSGCCDRIQQGDFTMTDVNMVRVFVNRCGSTEQNKIWKDAYDAKIFELFAGENLEVHLIGRGFHDVCGFIYLKI